MTTPPTPETYLFFQKAYDFFNASLFENSLPPCLITFQRQKRLMGYVSFKRWYNPTENRHIDELAINPEYFAHYPLVELFQTLCHEMVHIWQSHFGSPGRRGYHNEEWARKMIAIGLMPSTTGQPGGGIVGESMLDYILTDGSFVKACDTLLATGIQLAWVDAFPIARERAVVPSYDDHGTAAHHPASHASTLPVKKQAGAIIPVENALPYGLETLERAFIASLPFQEREEPVVCIPTTRPLSKSNRHKYYCKKCYLNVWGKPDLHILCGTCQLPLIESA